MTRIDHAARSERTAALGEGYLIRVGMTDGGATVAMLDALRDAVLALVEQQRIANEQMAEVIAHVLGK